MLAHAFYLLVTCMASLCSAIRVDWNTNTGPIVPPAPRTTVRPQPPFREPAAVWEPQHNDTPNPNPYVYVLPPPSRPRPATNNYLTADRQPVSRANYDDFNRNRSYGSLLQSGVEQHRPAAWHSVPGLGVKYVPGLGKKYYGVVPGGKAATYSSAKPAGYYFSGSGAGDKPQGKYNAKTKKYKVYEKPRHAAPQSNYYHVLPSELPLKQHQKQQQLEQQHHSPWLATQQLPVPHNAQPFSLAESPTDHKLTSEKHADQKPARKTKNEDRLTASSAFSLPTAAFSNPNELS